MRAQTEAHQDDSGQTGDEEALLVDSDRPTSAGASSEVTGDSKRSSTRASAVFNLGNTVVGAGELPGVTISSIS